MPIFPRRVIQRLLNENQSFLTEDQVNDHVNKLNAKNNASIATEWEVLILNVLSKIGRVQHEKKFNGTRKPDIFFESSNIGQFVADITAISDEFYDKENPISYFYKCLNEYFNAKGLTTRGIGVEVDSENVGKYGDRKVQLSLPKKKDVPSFVKKEFGPIIELIKRKPSEAFRFKIRKGNASITITFNPQRKYFTGGYTSYNVPYSINKNPIFNRLKRKADQLRKSGYQGVMGVFVCDASCDSLNNDFYGADQYSQDAIIQAVFKNNTSISFVIVLTPEEQHHTLGIKTTKFIKSNFYPNQHAKYPVIDKFFQEMKIIEKFFPIPQAMPINAKYRLNLNMDEGYSHYGGFTMSQNKIKISSRMITELFAGVLDFNKFDEDHKSMDRDKRNYVKEFFLRQLEQGKMMNKISIEKCQNEDDDWIEFEYGECDPAISKFQK